MKILWPVVLIWRDGERDCGGSEKLFIPFIYIRKGRTLTLVDPGERMEITLGKPFIFINGNIRVKKRPTEMSPEDLKKRAESLTHEKSDYGDEATKAHAQGETGS